MVRLWSCGWPYWHCFLAVGWLPCVHVRCCVRARACVQIKTRVHHYTRFYFEVHAPAARDGSKAQWVIGFAQMKGVPHEAVPGRNNSRCAGTGVVVCGMVLPPAVHSLPRADTLMRWCVVSSFGVCSDGRVLFNGEAVDYTRSLANDRVVGLVLDVGRGSISVVNGSGVELPPAFGRGSRIKPRKARVTEANAIQAAPLVPVVAILYAASYPTVVHLSRAATNLTHHAPW